MYHYNYRNDHGLASLRGYMKSTTKHKKNHNLIMLLPNFFHPIVHTIKVGFLSVYERKEKDAT